MNEINTYLEGDLPTLPRWASYDGNPLIKKAFVDVQYTEEQIEEILKCSEDIVYFAEKYVYIIDPDDGKVVIQLRDYQKRMLVHLKENRFSVVRSPRQTGKSTMFAIYLTWFSIFNKDKKSVILANKEKTAKEIFGRVKLAYERLPYWIQPGINEWNVTSMILENGSSVSCAATSADGIRGLTVNGCLVLDEYAFIKKNVADDFYTSVYPTISASKEAKIIIVSTPNGLNHYADLWKKAERKKNSYAPFRVLNSEIPGRDQAWCDRTEGDIGKKRFRQEYLAEFLGSTLTLIEAKKLEDLLSENSIDVLDYGLEIWEYPKEGHTYTIGVDSAKGTGGDYSVACVLDTSVMPIRQVAVYRNNTIGTFNYAYILEKIALYYNNAYLSVENNDIGSAVLQTLWNTIEYENIIDYKTTKKDLGIRATKKTKSQALDILKKYVESNFVIINDQQTIYELSRFVDNGNGTYSAEDGENDDCVSGLYWGLFITIMPNYYDPVNITVIKEEDVPTVEDEEPLDFYQPSNQDAIDMEEFTKELLI